MNFIGHAFVSGSYDLFMAGHLLGDASNGALLEGAPDRLLKGVRAHHALDRFTDRHPAFMEGSSILSETGGRYGPVLMDVAMDYFLVLHWERLHDEIFSGFVDRVYDVLRMQASVFPGAMGKLAEGIVERGAGVRLLRDNVVIHEGKLKTLKRFKDEVKDVQTGQECGMAFENYEDIRAGDVIECFRVEQVTRTL